jgi:hypothetical protein
VRDLGVGLVSVVDRDVRVPNRMHTMVDWAKQGVDQILLILLGSYAEIDLTDKDGRPCRGSDQRRSQL